MIKHISTRKDCRYIAGFKKDPAIDPSTIPGLVVWEPNDEPRTKTLVGDLPISRAGVYGTDYNRMFLDVLGVRAAVTRALWGGPELSSSTASYKLNGESMPTGSSPRTVAIWLYLSELTMPRSVGSVASGSIRLGEGNTSSKHNSYTFTTSFYEDSPGKVELRLSADINGQDKTITTPLTNLDLHSWHHIAVSTDEQGSSIYLDGNKLIESSDIKSSELSADEKFAHIFNWDSGTSYGFDWSKGAALADLCMYSRKLTDDEIGYLARQIVRDPHAISVKADNRGLDEGIDTPKPASTKTGAHLKHRFIDNTTLMLIDGATGLTELVHGIAPTVEGQPVCRDGCIDLSSGESRLVYDLSNCYDMDRGVYGDFTIEWSEYALNDYNGYGALHFERTSKRNESYEPWGREGLGVDELGGAFDHVRLRIDSRARTDSGFTFTRNLVPHIYTDTGKSNWSGAWHHVAVCRSGRVLMAFVDGIKVVQEVDAELLVADFSDAASCRYSSLILGSHGKIQRVKLSNVCRYSENFTPGEGWFYTEVAKS